MSLDFLILKKQQFSKLQKTSQSYPVGSIKVTPMSRSKLLVLKILNIKILCFFFSRIPQLVFCLKKDTKEMTIYLFTIIILNLSTLGVIKVTPSAIKITQFDGVTLIGLWFRIFSKKLIITYVKGSYIT